MSKQKSNRRVSLNFLAFIGGALCGSFLGFFVKIYILEETPTVFVESLDFSLIASLPALVELDSEENTLTIHNSSPEFCLTTLPFTPPFNGAQYYVENTNPETGTCILDYLD